MSESRNQINFLLGIEPTKKSIIKDKKIDIGRIARNEKMLEKIDDILANYRLSTKKLFEAEPRERIRCMKYLKKEDRDEVNYLISGLFK